MNWSKEFTIEELEELIKSDLNMDGWRGYSCKGCKPKQEYPFPAMINLPLYVQEWTCPRCGFVNILTWQKILPVIDYVDYGANGSDIVKVYQKIELLEKEILQDE